MSTLDNVKKLLKKTGTSEDDLLNLLITNAESWAAAYCRRDAVPSAAEPLICKMVVEDYNRLGTEGLTGEGYSGISYSYDTVYSESITKALRRYRKVLTIPS